jgi:eukaryotic-like serine/threonine-protein kinase
MFERFYDNQRSGEHRVGKYTVVGQLGRGGMGVVYRGYDADIRRDVALKVLRKADLDAYERPAILERFKREAQAAGSLQHPNVVAIYEYGEDDEYAFIAMECVPGRSLRDHLASGYRPEFREFPEVIDQVLEGLDYSHSRGVVHRDMKPANLLVSESGVVKISDFGIARLESSHMTMSGEVLGTPFYMSPEQFLGEPVDERTDIYSAAVITYEILTGRRPFDGVAAALMKQVLDDEPQPPSRFEPRLGPELDEVLLKALAKRADDRYRTAREFADALHQAFSMRPRAHTPASRSPEETTAPREAPAKVAGNAAALRRAISSSGIKDSITGGFKARKLDVTAPPAATPPTPLAGDALTAASAVTGPQSVAATPPVPAASPRRPRVLFVDDEERVLNALRSIFKNIYDIETASNGADALEILRSTHVHLLVSDQRMPGMLGVEVLRQAREIAPSTVRILLTGYSDLAAIVGSVNEGEVYRFVNKPWNQGDLQQIVAEAISIGLALQASPPREVRKRDDGLCALVLNDEPTYRAVRELVSSHCQVLHSTSLEETLHTLGNHDIAVLIADLEGGRVDNTVLFKVLKEEHPETLVIVTTGASDSELIIGLINEARIFRFVNKPLNLTLVQQHIIAALDRYQQFRASPQYAATQRARASAQARESNLGQAIVARLRLLSTRLTSAFKS